MASRSLTEVFILMRNNAVQSRNIYSEQHMSDNQRLIKRRIRDPEVGLEMRGDTRPPPDWTDKLEEAYYCITKVRTKLSELRNLHETVLHRPGLEDQCVEENQIDILAGEIIRLLSTVHRYAQHIQACNTEGSRTERKLTGNVVIALCTVLQQISGEFHTEQNKYLTHLQSREKRHQSYFDTPDFGMTDVMLPMENNVFLNDEMLTTDDYFLDNDIADANLDEAFKKPVSSQLSQQQLLLFEQENTKMAEQREREVNNIVRSIGDLNEIFKDLAHMIHDQGTVLDRIDYNIEQTQTQVFEGYKQLKKADTYQRKNRKMICITVLATVTLFLLILLIVIKS